MISRTRPGTFLAQHSDHVLVGGDGFQMIRIHAGPVRTRGTTGTGGVSVMAGVVYLQGGPIFAGRQITDDQFVRESVRIVQVVVRPHHPVTKRLVHRTGPRPALIGSLA
jgi:hypothetical protein